MLFEVEYTSVLRIILIPSGNIGYWMCFFEYEKRFQLITRLTIMRIWVLIVCKGKPPGIAAIIQSNALI